MSVLVLVGSPHLLSCVSTETCCLMLSASADVISTCADLHMGMLIKYIHHLHSFAIATVDDGLHDAGLG
jgi:hypothetical protein